MTHAFDIAQNHIESAIMHLTALEERLSRIDTVIVNHRNLTDMTSRALRMIEDSSRLMAQIDSSIRFANAGGAGSLANADNFARQSYEAVMFDEPQNECGCDAGNSLPEVLLSLLKARQNVASGINPTVVTLDDVATGSLAPDGLEPMFDAGEPVEMTTDDPDLPPEVAALIGALKAQGIEVSHAVRLN